VATAALLSKLEIISILYKKLAETIDFTGIQQSEK